MGGGGWGGERGGWGSTEVDLVVVVVEFFNEPNFVLTRLKVTVFSNLNTQR